MADIIRISDRLNPSRRSAGTREHKAEILFFTGIRYERLDPNAIWPRVELPTLPALVSMVTEVPLYMSGPKKVAPVCVLLAITELWKVAE